ncbi:MAG: hypothetical protein V2A61_03120, partial [Calditrichota bacterium]
MKVSLILGLGILIALLLGCTSESNLTDPTAERDLYSIQVSADPEYLDPENPETHSTITALCLNQEGQAVSAGLTVAFHTTLGVITP